MRCVNSRTLITARRVTRHHQKKNPQTCAPLTRFWQNCTPKSSRSGPNLSEQLTSQQQTTMAAQIREWAAELGFQQLGIADIELGEHEAYLQKWLDAGYHGSMEYMARHGTQAGAAR